MKTYCIYCRVKDELKLEDFREAMNMTLMDLIPVWELDDNPFGNDESEDDNNRRLSKVFEDIIGVNIRPA